MPGPNTGSNRFGPSSYIVGPELGNGVNFIDIQTAINQAVADGFDSTNPCTILVRPGIYTSFTMAPGILVEGVTAGSVFSNSAAVIGNVTIDSTTAGGSIYALKNMQISDPADALIFQGVGPAIIVDIANCSINGTRAVVIGNSSGTLSQIAFRECRMIGSTTGVDLQLHNSVFFFNTQVQGGTGVLMSGDARLRCFNTLIEGTVDYGVNITGTVNRLRLEFSSITAALEAVLGVNGGEVVNIEHCTVESNAPSGFFIDNVSIFEMYDVALTGSALGNNAIATNFIDWKPHAGTAANATLPGGVRGTSCFDSAQFTVTDGFVQATGALASTYPVDNGGPGVPSAGAMSFLGSTSVDFPNPSGIETHVGATTNEIYLEDRRFVSSLVVDPSATVGLRGEYQTITAALAAAVAGQTIYVRPGTYPESINLVDGVHIVGLSAWGQSNQVIVDGVVTVPPGGSCTLRNIRFTDGANLYTVEANGGGGTVTFVDCQIENVNTACFHLVDSDIVLNRCQVNAVNLGFQADTGSPTARIFYSRIDAGSYCFDYQTTASLFADTNIFVSAGAGVFISTSSPNVEVVNSQLIANASPCFDLQVGGTVEIRNNTLRSPGPGISFNAIGPVVRSYHNNYVVGGGAEYVIGPGQYEYGSDVVNPITAQGIDIATVQVKYGWRLWAESAAAPGLFSTKGTCSFDSNQFLVTDGFVQVTGGGSPPFVDASGAIAGVTNQGYYLTAASTLTLPAAPSQGDIVIVYADTAAAVVVTANAGQQIRVGNQISAVAGTATSSAIGDSLTLRFRAATSVWETVSSMGNWTIV